MSRLSTLTPIAAVLAVSLSGVSQAAENPFAAKPLSSGFTVAAHHEAGKEGKCGEGKCGTKADDKSAKEGKCGEGKCGTKKDAADAKKDDKAAKEGKCGEG
ncbi:MAG: hypothetical protein Q7T32_07610 [Moraxellaceae bacterium]|nr:hypothetical protein [Moraxellaceae bacterium]